MSELVAAVERRRRRAYQVALEAAERAGDGDVRSEVELDQALADVAHYGNLAERLASEAAHVGGGPYGDGRHSLFRDLAEVRGIVEPRGADMYARQRIAEHRRHLAALAGMEARDTGSGDLAGLVPEAFGVGADTGVATRSGRPLLASLLDAGSRVPLPATGQFVSLPAVTTATVAASQSGENTVIGETDVAVTDRQVPVVTVTARIDASRQIVDRGGAIADRVLGLELTRALESEQERQLIAGSGANGEMTGLLDTAGIGTVTCASTTGAGQSSCVLQAVRESAETRGTMPAFVAATPTRKLHWADESPSGGELPVIRRADAGDYTIVPTTGIPTDLGTGEDEDRVLVVDPLDLVYAEDPVVRIGAIGQLAGQGTVVVQAFRYAALAVAHPANVFRVIGAGLAAPGDFTA